MCSDFQDEDTVLLYGIFHRDSFLLPEGQTKSCLDTPWHITHLDQSMMPDQKIQNLYKGKYILHTFGVTRDSDVPPQEKHRIPLYQMHFGVQGTGVS